MRVARSRRLVLSLAAVLVAVTAACVTSHPLTVDTRTTRSSLTLPRDIRVRTGGHVVSVPLEDYVLAAALSEVSPVNEAPATTARVFEVQAIIARTYVIAHLRRHADEGFDACDTTHCQLYQPGRISTSRFADAARAAVDATRGVVLLYGNRAADALFHADCGGHTASASDVWGGPSVPYLTGEADAVPDDTHRSWQSRLSADRLRDALATRTRALLGPRLKNVRVSERDGSGRAEAIDLEGDHVVTVRGDSFRAAITREFGTQALQSTQFAVTRDGGTFVFSGRGYGHGVGLCQVGAAARARRGESVDEILSAYFPGAAVARALAR
ncbi:MAG: SpoIID/LytB domain-containing protein [Acidobacteriota bacterium]